MKRLLLIAAKLTGGSAAIVVVALSGVWTYFAAREGAPAAPRAVFARVTRRPLIFAHRGGGGAAEPENTLGAFRHSVSIGADVLELDVHSTRDGALVVMHDAKVDRTTNGSGAVASFALDELQKLDAGFRFTTDGGATFPFRGKGVAVPTLGEIFDAFPDKQFNIEPKQTEPSIAAPLCAMIREHGAADRVIVSSFRQDAVDDFRAACPEVATGATPREAFGFFGLYKTGVAASARPAMNALQIPQNLGPMDVVNADFVAAAHRMNLQVHVWTINDEADMKRLKEAGVDGIMTDFPERAMNALAEAK